MPNCFRENCHLQILVKQANSHRGQEFWKSLKKPENFGLNHQKPIEAVVISFLKMPYLPVN